MPKVLIVDDEAHIRLLLEQTLEDFEEEGIEIITAADGKTALELMLQEKPDLVFLDLMLPDISGFEVCYKIKNEYRMMRMFIIMLTAKGQDIDKKKGLDCGANMYMTKPFDPDFVVKKTVEILNIAI